MSFAARVFIHCLILTGMCLPAAGLAILVLAYGFGKQSLEAMLLPEVIVVSVTIFLLSIALSIISGILLAGTEFFKKQMPVLEEHIKRYVEELIPKLLAQTEMGGYGIDVGVVQKIVETGGSGLFEFGQETGSWFSPGRMLHSWTVKKVVTFFRLSLTEDYMTWLREKDENQATLASLEEFARQRLVGVIVGRLKDQVTSIRTKTIYSVAGFILLPIISAFSLRIYTAAFPGPIGLVTHYGQQIVNARKQIKFPQEFASLKVIADCQPRKRSMKAAKTKAARTRFERTKPHLNVYLVGHSLLDKAALTSAIMLERCKQGFADYFPFELLMEIPEKKKRGLTISTAHVEYESELRHYAHAFTPGLDDDLKNLITGATQMDGVVLLVSSATGITSDLQKMTYLASRYGIDRMVVYLDQSIIELDRPDLQAMVSEIKELMDSNGVAGYTPIIIGSTLKALKSDLSAMGLDSITTLVQAMDEHFPDRIRDIDRLFLMPVEDAFSISGRGTVATGKVEFGHINIGDKVDIVGLRPTRQVTVIGIEMFRKLLDAGQAGDNIGIVLEGISKEDVSRGQVLAAPGSMKAVKTFEALTYILSLDEGGRVIPISQG